MKFEAVDDGVREASAIAGHGIETVRFAAGTTFAGILFGYPGIEAIWASVHERIEAFGIELVHAVGADY